jgi:hypothetical protein
MKESIFLYWNSIHIKTGEKEESKLGLKYFIFCSENSKYDLKDLHLSSNFKLCPKCLEKKGKELTTYEILQLIKFIEELG